MESKMGTQVQLAGKRLFDADALGVKNIKLFPGSSRDISAEQLAREINKVLSELAAGDASTVEEMAECA
jgi:hypothetical protein